MAAARRKAEDGGGGAAGSGGGGERGPGAPGEQLIKWGAREAESRAAAAPPVSWPDSGKQGS